MDGSEINYVRLEEQLNRLLYDPEIRALRGALPAYVTGKLREGMTSRLRELGFTPAAEAEFLSAQAVRTTRVFQLVQDHQEQIGLSGRMLRQFRMMAGADRPGALAFLQEVLLEKEQIRFRQEAGIPAKVWLNFLNCRNLTGEATLEKMRSALGLSPEECAQFNSRAIRCVFSVNEALREEVHRLREGTGMSVSQFLVYAWISKDAWEAFYPARQAGEQEHRQTSQETLLKLLIGYGLDEDAARAFLGIAGSAFVVRRDLVVLSGVRCGYCQPMQIQEILEFFSLGRDGQRYFDNLYRL